MNKIKPRVNDFYSITALHYVNGGEQALFHFNYLMNCVINDVNSAASPELNTVHAHILHKGHNKDRSLDTSYRTISTCPLLAKALDVYVRELSIDKMEDVQAETQFQGSGTSHEHAAILLTEVIHQATVIDKKPVFALFLDARSAFDFALLQILARRLFLDGIQDQKLAYIIKRLENRKTFCEWNRQLMGPINDSQGLEQGGVNSSEFYPTS